MTLMKAILKPINLRPEEARKYIHEEIASGPLVRQKPASYNFTPTCRDDIASSCVGWVQPIILVLRTSMMLAALILIGCTHPTRLILPSLVRGPEPISKKYEE
jgi:hypothetical protein